MREIPFMVRNKYFTAIQQVASLKSAYKFNNSRWILRHHGFTWFFDVTPTPISDTYKLKIVYNETFYPLVYVVSPKPLALAKGATKLPHTYDSNIIAKTKRATFKNETSKSSLFSLPFFSCSFDRLNTS